MPRRKKIRTTSTDASPSRHARRLRAIREQIAAEAARIMATEGQHNFLAAKHKAAERLGIHSRQALPSNVEIDEALRTYQQLYGGQRHSDNVRALRRCAVATMRDLASFKPRLVGPVLEGTADEYSRVSLQVFSDPPDAVAMHFLESGRPYHLESRMIRWHDGGHREVPVLVTDIDGNTVELTLLREVDLRQSPPSPVDGRPQRRASINEVELLIETDNDDLLVAGG